MIRRRVLVDEARRRRPGWLLARHPWLALLVGALLASDVILIGLDLTLGAALSWPDVLRVNHEQGLPEWIMYAKWLVTAAAMAVLSLSGSGRLAYALWAAAYAYLAFDDALSIHERVAGKVGQWFPFDQWLGLPFEAWVILEPLYMVGVGLGLITVLFVALRRAPDPAAARYSVEAIVLLAIFVAFAGVGDVIGRVGFGGTHLPEVLEDGGEMLVATIIVGHALLHAVTVRDARSGRRDASQGLP
jgi:hypothetical protein